MKKREKLQLKMKVKIILYSVSRCIKTRDTPNIIFGIDIISFSVSASNMDFSLPLFNVTFCSANKHQERFHAAAVADHNLKIASTAYVQDDKKFIIRAY